MTAENIGQFQKAAWEGITGLASETPEGSRRWHFVIKLPQDTDPDSVKLATEENKLGVTYRPIGPFTQRQIEVNRLSPKGNILEELGAYIDEVDILERHGVYSIQQNDKVLEL